MRNKEAYQFHIHSLVLPVLYLINDHCIIQKQFGRLNFRKIDMLTRNKYKSDVCQYLKNVVSIQNIRWLLTLLNCPDHFILTTVIKK